MSSNLTHTENQERNENLPINTEKINNQISQTHKSFIQEFKENKITREAALTVLNQQMDARVKQTFHAIERETELQNKRIDLIANKYLEKLNQEYLADLEQLGIKNLDARGEALTKLILTYSEKLQKIDSQNVPEQLKVEAKTQLEKQYKKLLDKMGE